MQSTTNIPDGLNPIFLFNTIHTDLLLKIVSGGINPKALAKQELDNRGLDHNTGKWIGFKKK